jgi:hypothetical protein
MKTFIVVGLLLFLFSTAAGDCATQQGTAKTEVAGAGPCTNFPTRYQTIEERLAWFYGCMHENPPTLAEVRAKIAALPADKQAILKRDNDFATQEALIYVGSYAVPIQVFPK